MLPSEATQKMTLWHSPSGRLHGMRYCSGGAGRRNTRRVVTREVFAILTNKCRCVGMFRPDEERIIRG